MLPYGSAAVIVNACAAPAVWLAEPVTTSREAAAGPTVIETFPDSVPSVTATVGLSAL